MSVVIPCFNHGHFLAGAIESVVAQTHSPIEIIVVDDGSTDNTAEVAARFPQISYFYQGNAGLAAARNTGLRAAGGDYVCFLDADDVLYPSGIELGLACFAKNPECGYVWGGFRLVSEGDEEAIERLPGTRNVDYCALLKQNWISMIAAVLFRTPLLSSAGGFDRSLRASEDYEVYLRIARQFPIASHQGLVAECRRHGANMSGNPRLMLLTTLRVLQAQEIHARRDRNRRAALRQGYRLYRRVYGGRLVQRGWMELKAGHLRAALAALHCVLLHAPGAPLVFIGSRIHRLAAGLARRLKLT